MLLPYEEPRIWQVDLGIKFWICIRYDSFYKSNLRIRLDNYEFNKYSFFEYKIKEKVLEL